MNEGAAEETSREASRDNILGTTSLSLQSSVYKSNIVQNIHEQYLHQDIAGRLLDESDLLLINCDDFKSNIAFFQFI